MSLITLIYGSAAVDPFTEPELIALLEKSRANNQSLGVTGMLVYRDGNFLQVLEGEAEQVDTDRIVADIAPLRVLECGPPLAPRPRLLGDFPTRHTRDLRGLGRSRTSCSRTGRTGKRPPAQRSAPTLMRALTSRWVKPCAHQT